MKPDLEALHISKGELRKLSDFETANLSILLCFIAALFIAGLAWVPSITLIFATFKIPISPYLVIFLLAFFSGSLIFHLIKSNERDSLGVLLNQVDKFNAVIQAIDIRDQLEEIGHLGASIPEKQREELINTLSLTREDLTRALKTEKLLRTNKDFIINNPNLFTNEFRSLKELQMRYQNDTNEPLMNDVLQIASTVQNELQKLRDRKIN